MHGVVGGTKQATEQTTNGRRGPRGEEQEDRGWIRQEYHVASECQFFLDFSDFL